MAKRTKINAIQFEGKIFSGSGEAAKFVSLPWVKEQITEKLGFTPYNGTLNIRLDENAIALKRRILNKAKAIKIQPPEGFCQGKLFKAIFINKLECAVVIPEVNGYPEKVIEIVAPINLREKFQLKDGDTVKVKILVEMLAIEDEKPKPRWWIPYWLIQIILAIAIWVASYFFLNLPFHVASIGLAFTLILIGVLYSIRLKQPNWLKPYLITLTISIIAFGAINYFLLDVPLERVAASTIFVLLAISFGYYIRIRPNVKINRVIYIGLGALVLGFIFWIVLMALMRIGIKWLTGLNIVDGIFALPILILCYIAGGYIGDWIGKRRGYRIPLYP